MSLGVSGANVDVKRRVIIYNSWSELILRIPPRAGLPSMHGLKFQKCFLLCCYIGGMTNSWTWIMTANVYTCREIRSRGMTRRVLYNKETPTLCHCQGHYDKKRFSTIVVPFVIVLGLIGNFYHIIHMAEFPFQYWAKRPIKGVSLLKYENE